MRHRKTAARFLLALLFIVSMGGSHAADAPSASVPAGVTRVVTGAHPGGFGGGSIPAPRDVITQAQRDAIQKEIEAGIIRLSAEGRLAPTAVDAHPQFGWPLRMAAGIDDPGYHGISNYVDLNPNYPGALLDFNCGDRTYDTADGYNHSGTDLFTWPWTWRKMDRGEIEIVAAAPGQIVYRNDGNFDRSCGFNNNDWNAVYVQHADGSVAWYGHMKNGSPTTKPVGSMVAQGEYLGVVGSSGNSTGPHLHFEVVDPTFHTMDPWAGPCNTLTPDSWWASQRPYYESAVDRLTTGFGAPNFGSCPSSEVPNIQSSFAAGATIFFTAYYSDQLDTRPSTYTIYRPDGSVYSQWIHSSPAPYYAESYWFWSYAIPAGEPQGIWRFTVSFQSNTYERLFTIGSPAACGAVPEFAAQGDVVKVERITTFIRLTWGASCNPGDTDYAVYEGSLGNFASHAPIRCTTSGTKAALVTPAAGNRYYLIAPRNAAREGSLGTTSSGAERSGGVSSCVARFALQCP